MSPEQELRKKLAEEIDQAPWSALVRHFAFGRVYVVREPWTLVEAALAFHQDAKDLVKEAISQKHLEQPTADEVKDWTQSSPGFDVLVISPFVLIQPRSSAS